MEVNLVDKNFEGRDLSQYPTDFKWNVSSTPVSKHIFFTDYCLHEVINCTTDQKKVAWLLEPKAICSKSYDYIEENYNLFDYVLTFDRELLQKINNGLYTPYGTYWVENNVTYNKHKMVSIIASFKNETLGHKIRHHIINTASGFDIYGKHPNYKYVESKNEALDDYYFSITVENSIQNSYWTEKLLDCFVTKTIPIYWGTKDVCNFFNEDGIIFFNKASELRDILNNLTPELYRQKVLAIEENYKLALQYKDPEDYIFKNYNHLIS
jgi:hypothetical protein